MTCWNKTWLDQEWLDKEYLDKLEWFEKEYSIESSVSWERILIKQEWLESRIVKGLARSSYESKKIYSNVLHKMSMPCWAWYVSQELDVVRCKRWTNINCCVYFLSVISFTLHVIIIFINPRMKVMITIWTKHVFN